MSSTEVTFSAALSDFMFALYVAFIASIKNANDSLVIENIAHAIVPNKITVVAPPPPNKTTVVSGEYSVDESDDNSEEPEEFDEPSKEEVPEESEEAPKKSRAKRVSMLGTYPSSNIVTRSKAARRLKTQFRYVHKALESEKVAIEV